MQLSSSHAQDICRKHLPHLTMLQFTKHVSWISVLHNIPLGLLLSFWLDTSLKPVVKSAQDTGQLAQDTGQPLARQMVT